MNEPMRGIGFVQAMKSGGGPPQSKTLARCPMTDGMREASWSSAPVLWRFGLGAGVTGNVSAGVRGLTEPRS